MQVPNSLCFSRYVQNVQLLPLLKSFLYHLINIKLFLKDIAQTSSHMCAIKHAYIWSVNAVYVYVHMLVLIYPLEDSVVTTNYLTTYNTNKFLLSLMHC